MAAGAEAAAGELWAAEGLGSGSAAGSWWAAGSGSRVGGEAGGLAGRSSEALMEVLRRNLEVRFD